MSFDDRFWRENTNIGACLHQETCTSGTVGDIKEATVVGEWASGTFRRLSLAW